MGEDYLSLEQLSEEPVSLWSADPWQLIDATLPDKVCRCISQYGVTQQRQAWAEGC